MRSLWHSGTFQLAAAVGSAACGERAHQVPPCCFSRPQKSYEHFAKIRVAREAAPECNCPPGNRYSLEIASRRLVTLGCLVSMFLKYT